MSFRLRDFVLSDADAVNAVALAAWDQFRSSYADSALIFKGVAKTADLANSAQLIVAESSGLVVGAVGYVAPGVARYAIFEPEWAVMRMLVVKPSARGKGIGRLLAEECISRAHRDEAGIMALHTAEIMTVALAMYQRMGFSLLRAVPDMNGVKYGIYIKAQAA